VYNYSTFTPQEYAFSVYDPSRIMAEHINFNPLHVNCRFLGPYTLCHPMHVYRSSKTFSG